MSGGGYLDMAGGGYLYPTKLTLAQLTVNGAITLGDGTTITGAGGFATSSGGFVANLGSGYRFSNGLTAITSGGNTLGLQVSDTLGLTLRGTSVAATVDATPTAMSNPYTPADADVIVGTVYVTAKDTVSIGAGYVIHFAGRKTGGVATLIAAVATPLAAEDGALAAAAATVIASGGGFVVQVTGIAATTIDWDAVWVVLIGS